MGNCTWGGRGVCSHALCSRFRTWKMSLIQEGGPTGMNPKFQNCKLHTLRTNSTIHWLKFRALVSDHSFLPIACRNVFFGQYNCFGPGSAQAARVPWAKELSFDEAQPFLSLAFIDGEQWVNHQAAFHLTP